MHNRRVVTVNEGRALAPAHGVYAICGTARSSLPQAQRGYPRPKRPVDQNWWLGV